MMDVAVIGLHNGRRPPDFGEPAGMAQNGDGQKRPQDGIDGDQLRRLRLEHGLSVRQLSVRSSVSPSMLSQMERGLTTPSLQTLKRIAEALGVSMFQILPDESPAAEASLVVRADSRRRVVLHEDQLVYDLLSPNTKGQLEVWSGRMDGGQAGPVSAHQSEEFILVMSGQMEITLGVKSYVLGPGDSIQYDGTIAHSIRACGTEQLHFISALTPPTL
jgi:transcriptional regulator with XRE-family HTH domain